MKKTSKEKRRTKQYEEQRLEQMLNYLLPGMSYDWEFKFVSHLMITRIRLPSVLVEWVLDNSCIIDDSLLANELTESLMTGSWEKGRNVSIRVRIANCFTDHLQLRCNLILNLSITGPTRLSCDLNDTSCWTLLQRPPLALADTVLMVIVSHTISPHRYQCRLN